MNLSPVIVNARDPRAVFILILCVISGIPLILNRVEPGSVEALLPSWGVVLWGISLVGGALVTLVGMALQKRHPSGILVEQFGNAAVGIASIFYAFALVRSTWPEGALVSGIIAGWGISCLWRWWQIQRAVSLVARAR